MPAESVTLGGGAVLHTYLASQNTALAANIINGLGFIDTTSFNTETSIPVSGAKIITDITSATGPQTYALTSTTGGTVLADATNYNDTLDVSKGNAGTGYILVGNDANDTFNIGTNTATVVTGDGNNIINVGNGGSLDLVTDGGHISVNMGGGVFEQQGYSGDPQGPASVTIGLGAGGTLYVGPTLGNDTINALGSATVYGGQGNFVFNGDSGQNSTVYAGSGSETLFGGSGASTNLFDASGESQSSVDSLVGGGFGANNTFIGGAGTDTMVSGAFLGANSDIFQFNASVGGGTHTITNFGGNDVVDIVGYGSSIPAADIVENAAGTTITLSDHTKIFVAGVDLNSNQIKFS